MPNSKPTKEELEKLSKQIKQDQRSSSPAEKRVKIGMSFKKAVKKIVQASPPKKKEN
ncbi:MAG TPA: hypothetical protein VLE99_05450 [Candidatus Saccharimonadales bacterium]|nr:hypothetical protein [Candidatus Saccharimonadales bacterium]